MRKHITSIFIALIVLVPVSIYGVVKWTEQEFAELPILRTEDHSSYLSGLKDQYGNDITLEEEKGKLIVANFFFTHCPVVCPRMIKQLQRVQAFTKEDNTEILSFSVDPDRDSIQRLAQYAKQVGIAGNWKLVTGEKQKIYALARKGLNVVATDGDGGPEDFIHSELFVLIDQSGSVRGYYKGTDEQEVNKMIKDIKKL